MASSPACIITLVHPPVWASGTWGGSNHLLGGVAMPILELPRANEMLFRELSIVPSIQASFGKAASDFQHDMVHLPGPGRGVAFTPPLLISVLTKCESS